MTRQDERKILRLLSKRPYLTIKEISNKLKLNHKRTNIVMNSLRKYYIVDYRIREPDVEEGRIHPQREYFLI